MYSIIVDYVLSWNDCWDGMDGEPIVKPPRITTNAANPANAAPPRKEVVSLIALAFSSG